MDISFVNMWLKSLIKEEINREQLRSVGEFLKMEPEELQDWVMKTDPTPNQAFGVWLLRGLKKEWIRLEDDRRIKEALQRFILLRRQNRIADIMQFPMLNDLEDEIARISGDTQQGKRVSGLDPTSLPGVEVYEDRPEKNEIYYKVSDAGSLAKMGEGTKWCTRFSYQKSNEIAQKYINKYKYILIGFKDGKPFVQFNPDYSQVQDVNDVSFHKTVKGKSLQLPPPEFTKQGVKRYTNPKVKYIRPVDPKSYDNLPLTSKQVNLKAWMDYAYDIPNTWEKYVQPHKLRTMSTEGRDLNYEKRLAKAITHTKNHEYFNRMMGGFFEYARNELKSGERSKIVEKALIDKDFRDIQQNFGLTSKGAGGSKIREKRVGINGLVFIAAYVRNNIRGHWPEFEKKLQNDPSNSIEYYKVANLNPDPSIIGNSLVRDVVLFSKMIEEKHPTVSNPEFNEAIKDFLEKTRDQWKHGNFSIVISKVIEPYLEMTNQSLQDVVGNELAQKVARNWNIGRGTEYWRPKE